jgi:hypothetical protein
MEKFLNPYEVLFDKLTSIEAVLLKKQLVNPLQAEIYLKIDKAADFLSTSPNALRVMASKGQIPHIKKHSKLFFRQSELIEWLESGSVYPDEQDDLETSLVATKKRF